MSVTSGATALNPCRIGGSFSGSAGSAGISMTFLIAHLPIVPFEPFWPASRYHSQIDDEVNIRTDSSGHWLESSILHLVEESVSGRVGSEAMLTKLSEALFVDTLRRYVAGLPEQQMEWLAGARDPIVGKSLGLLHSRIAHPWTIAVADEVGI